MPKIHLVEGPVGAGKSTYCTALAKRTGGVHIALDEWFVRLFSPDRPSTDVVLWYMQRKERLLDHIWTHALALLAAEVTPILELGLVQRQSRTDFNRERYRVTANPFPCTAVKRFWNSVPRCDRCNERSR
jgi:predicted kinase